MTDAAQKQNTNDDVVFGRQVLETEMQALGGLCSRLGESFSEAVELILNCTGRVVVTGVGKPGIIGQKISATLASTGTPSYWLHPVEAVHGDLGRIVAGDVTLALSNSGETEVAELMPSVKRIGAKVIAVTGNPQSSLARHADVVLDIGPIQEARPLELAPSASTTAMLAMGDALALAVARRRDFSKEQYALYHPGGELGRKLLRVEECMRGLDECASVTEEVAVTEALTLISTIPIRAGAICIVDADGKLRGIFTDGDLRRRVVSGETEFLKGPISAVMTREPKCVRIGDLAHEAAKILEEYKIDEVPVVDETGKLCGILDVQDLLAVRVVAS